LTVSYATSHLVLNADELLQGVIEAALCLPVHVITGSEGSTQIKLFFYKRISDVNMMLTSGLFYRYTYTQQ